MTSHDAITAFAQLHSFNADDLSAEELDGIQCAVDCHNAIRDDYANLPRAVLEQDVAIEPIWQLYVDCTERVHAALVAMATACFAASEIVARAAIEATVTIRYILRDRNKRLASFFRDHIDRVEQQEKQWRKAAERLQAAERAAHLAACDSRARDIATSKKYVDLINSQLVPSETVPAWPDMDSRFEAVGESMEYRTLYARLGTEPHFDAERALLHFVGKSTSPSLLKGMTMESFMFSNFLLAAAVRAYAKTGKELAAGYNMSAAMETCAAAEHLMDHHFEASQQTLREFGIRIRAGN